MADLTPDRLQELHRIAAETTPGTYEWRIIKTALALLDRVERLEADNYNLGLENHELYRRIERLEAKLARQRVALRRLQAAVERRNSQERIDALLCKLSEDKRLLDRIEALEAENERLRQIEAAARTLVDTAFEVTGPDEYIYQAVRVDYFDTLAALLKGEGGASDA